ncbi:MAG: phage terminase large subunit family protein [Candidatus Competibacteraceae bacterium]|nr:phage terminase large subunit family protein [Candidatus Competibacteraceae bacterium]
MTGGFTTSWPARRKSCALPGGCGYRKPLPDTSCSNVPVPNPVRGTPTGRRIWSSRWTSGPTAKKEAIAFVGPARAGKTFALLIGGLAYFVTCDPGDYLIVHMAENTARKFSKDELARSHRHSPELAARLSPYASDDNVFDKRYKNGMLLKLAWPSINQLSGDTLRYVALTDYDRYLESIDGAGDAFRWGASASKR